MSIECKSCKSCKSGSDDEGECFEKIPFSRQIEFTCNSNIFNDRKNWERTDLIVF